MAEESAGYRYHERIEASGTREKKYFCVSTSRAAKLEERLAIVLKDRGFDIDREILIERDGTDFTITRMVGGSQNNWERASHACRLARITAPTVKRSARLARTD